MTGTTLSMLLPCCCPSSRRSTCCSPNAREFKPNLFCAESVIVTVKGIGVLAYRSCPQETGDGPLPPERGTIMTTAGRAGVVPAVSAVPGKRRNGKSVELSAGRRKHRTVRMPVKKRYIADGIVSLELPLWQILMRSARI